jgi:hypothetical protein
MEALAAILAITVIVCIVAITKYFGNGRRGM